LKKLADDADKSLTFIAKCNEFYPGNSMNLKLIIKDKSTGKNIFDGKIYSGLFLHSFI